MNKTSSSSQTETPDQEQDIKPQRSKGKWLLLLLSVLILAAAGWWYLPTLTQKISTSADDTQLSSTENKTEEVLEPETTLGTAPQTYEHDNSAIIKSLSERIKTLEQQQQTPSVQPTARLNFTSIPDFGNILVALHRLEERVRTSKPFREELNNVLSEIPVPIESFGPAVAELLALADRGVNTPEQLAQEFEALLATRTQSVAEQSNNNSWIGKSKNWAKKLISVRHTSSLQKSKPQTDSVFDRVRNLLISNNLAAILEHRIALERTANPNMKEWIEHLHKRVIVQQTIIELKPITLTLFVLSHLNDSTASEDAE